MNSDKIIGLYLMISQANDSGAVTIFHQATEENIARDPESWNEKVADFRSIFGHDPIVNMIYVDVSDYDFWHTGKVDLSI